MDLAQTVTNALVVGAVGLILGLMVHGLRSELNQLRSELKQEIAALRAGLKQEIAELRREIGELRSDLTRVALAVGTEPPRARSQ